MNFPKTIWMYWHQGFDEAPEIIQHCVKQWQLLHPKWTIHLLDKKNVDSYIDSLPLAKLKLDELTLAHRSDLIRTKLLILHGGVWADPTCFPLIPLEEWLYKNMESGLFLFYKPGRDRIISNWFIASERGNPLLKKLLIELCHYWENNTFINRGQRKIWYETWIKKIYNRSLWSTKLWFTWFTQKVLKLYPYMVYHYKFYELISKDSQSNTYWQKMSKISALGPHKLQRAGLLAPLLNETKEIIDNKEYPLFKLSWKIKDAIWRMDSVLGYLFKQPHE